MNSNFKEVLKEEAKKNNIVISADKLEQFDVFRDNLIDWNGRVNLTRIIEPYDFAKKHVIDSLMLLKHVDIKPSAKLIDVGTGPGIPGLIIKIYRPDISLSLLESVGKKTNFLNLIVENMNLQDVKVINNRAEIVGHDMEHREKYDIVVARAVSALNALSEICLPFVRPRGIFVAMKGPSPDEEIRSSERALGILGGKLKTCTEYVLDGDMRRTLVIIDKIRNCPNKYPRKPGIPGKAPL
ncbi:MAG: 16S rRNA (guanine(527)-N(7))-methyltransferase RsmG [Tepidanaerobacteraceae bacterium]